MNTTLYNQLVSEQSQCLLLNTDKISVNILKRAVTV